MESYCKKRHLTGEKRKKSVARLYHGTLAENVECILRDGLRPRGRKPPMTSILGGHRWLSSSI